MTYIESVPEEAATGATAEMYAADREIFGDLPNFTRGFSLHPEVYAAWRQLNGAIKNGMDLRRYELATVAAAQQLRSSYCMLAHGTILAEKFMDPADVRALASERASAETLDEADLAVMELASKVADDATSVAQEDIDRLRSLGLADAEIMGVVLAATARCFFSKTLDALGIEPDAKYADVEPGLRDALTVGRPIAGR